MRHARSVDARLLLAGLPSGPPPPLTTLPHRRLRAWWTGPRRSLPRRCAAEHRPICSPRRLRQSVLGSDRCRRHAPRDGCRPSVPPAWEQSRRVAAHRPEPSRSPHGFAPTRPRRRALRAPSAPVPTGTPCACALSPSPRPTTVARAWSDPRPDAAHHPRLAPPRALSRARTEPESSPSPSPIAGAEPDAEPEPKSIAGAARQPPRVPGRPSTSPVPEPDTEPEPRPSPAPRPNGEPLPSPAPRPEHRLRRPRLVPSPTPTPPDGGPTPHHADTEHHRRAEHTGPTAMPNSRSPHRHPIPSPRPTPSPIPGPRRPPFADTDSPRRAPRPRRRRTCREPIRRQEAALLGLASVELHALASATIHRACDRPRRALPTNKVYLTRWR